VKKITGYVCAATPEEGTSTVLYGLAVNNTFEIQAENIQTNGLVPFPTFKEAEDAKSRLSKAMIIQSPCFKTVEIKRLTLTIAEKWDELLKISKAKGFVFVANGPAGTDRWILGPSNSKSQIQDGYAFFFSNGLVPFRSLDRAMRTCSEFVRQSRTARIDAQVASIFLRKTSA
jgi:hypothetical protein